MNSPKNYSSVLIRLVKIWISGSFFPTFLTLYWFVSMNEMRFLLWSAFNVIPLLSYLAFKFYKSTRSNNNEKIKNNFYELVRFLYIIYFVVIFVVIILSTVAMSRFDSSILQFLEGSYIWLGLFQAILFVATTQIRDTDTEPFDSNPSVISVKNDIDLDKLKSELRKNIENNEFDLFFKKLEQHKPDEDKISLLKAQYNKLNNEISKGIIDKSSETLQWNKIRTNSLEIISNL